MKRDTSNSILGGVCSGIANHFKIDTSLVRIAFLAAFLFAGVGPLLYLLMWVIIPAE